MNLQPAQSVARRPRIAVSVGVALMLGLLLRLFFIAKYPRLAGDTLIYADFARNWLEQGIYGYTQNVGGQTFAHPSLIRLPGYPMFLAGVFVLFGHRNYYAVLIVQALVGLVTCMLSGLTTRRLFGGRAGMAALWLGCLCPFTATYVASALSETLVLCTMALAFYALVRWQDALAASGDFNRWLFVLAAALGYSILLRPEQGLVVASIVPAVLWMAWKRRVPGRSGARNPLLPGLVLSLLVLLPLVPWTVRNERTFHLFQPLAPKSATDPGELIPAGFDGWFRTWAIEFASNNTAYWQYNSDMILISDLPRRAFDSQAQYLETDEVLEDYNRTTTYSPELEARFAALARQRVQGHALRYYVWLPTARVVDMYFRPRTELLPVPDEWWHPVLRPRTFLIAMVFGALNLFYFGAALTGFLHRRALALQPVLAEPVVWALAATVVLRTALLFTLDNAEPRYTLEFFPVAYVLAGAWLARSAFPPANDTSRSS